MEVFDLKRKLLQRPPGGRNGRESFCDEEDKGDLKGNGGAKRKIGVSRIQAEALAKLIRAQIAAYGEAEGGERRDGAEEAFTGEDLDALASLLAVLERGRN